MCLNWKHTPIASHGPRVLVLSPVLDHRGCGQRDHRLEPAEIKQPGAASAASPVRHQAGKALKPNIGLPTLTLFTTKPRDAEAKQLVNEAKTLASIDAEVKAFHVAQEAMAPPAPPIVVEHPIDTTVQTGDSALLGGGMSIHAPWKRD